MSDPRKVVVLPDQYLLDDARPTDSAVGRPSSQYTLALLLYQIVFVGRIQLGTHNLLHLQREGEVAVEDQRASVAVCQFQFDDRDVFRFREYNLVGDGGVPVGINHTVLADINDDLCERGGSCSVEGYVVNPLIILEVKKDVGVSQEIRQGLRRIV